MKNNRRAVPGTPVYALILLASLLAGGLAGCGKGAAGDVRSYRGSEPLLAASFDYPAAWKLKEDRGEREPYAQAAAFGPRNRAGTFTPAFVVRGVPAELYGSLQEYRDSYLSHLYKAPVIDHAGSAAVDGRPALDVTVDYTMPALHKPGLKNEEVPLRARLVFVRNGQALYLVAHIADRRQFKEHTPAFDKLLRSLRFQ